jgi:phenylalanine-4-hydroxylase
MDLELVQLDRDHPGFRDADYRARRNAIAALALRHRIGSPVTDVEYVEDEHAVWRTVLEHLAPLHARYACAAYRAAWPAAGLEGARVPTFEAVNARLFAATGFRLEPVGGLVTAARFMEHLAGGTFLATQYMRHHSAPLYTPEPDVVHELVGHAPGLLDPAFADVNRLFGEATRRASPEEIEQLIRAYWYTLEFGVARGPRGLEVYGAGLLSSFGELGRFEAEAELLPFDLAAIAAQPFDPTDYQRVLFVAESVDQALRELRVWLQRVGRGRAQAGGSNATP